MREEADIRERRCEKMTVRVCGRVWMCAGSTWCQHKELASLNGGGEGVYSRGIIRRTWTGLSLPQSARPRAREAEDR
jgi:hypothetical protein